MKRELRATPRQATLEKLSAGLELPLERVQAAAAQSIGLAVELKVLSARQGAQPSLRLIMELAEQLDEDERERAAAILEALLSAQRRRQITARAEEPDLFEDIDVPTGQG